MSSSGKPLEMITHLKSEINRLRLTYPNPTSDETRRLITYWSNLKNYYDTYGLTGDYSSTGVKDETTNTDYITFYDGLSADKKKIISKEFFNDDSYLLDAIETQKEQIRDLPLSRLPTSDEKDRLSTYFRMLMNFYHTLEKKDPTFREYYSEYKNIQNIAKFIVSLGEKKWNT